MDDIIIFGPNKKKLHKMLQDIREYLKNEALIIKENWQVSKTDSAQIDFIGKRFARGYTTLRDTTFLRLKRRIKKISKKNNLTYNDAVAVISYNGILKHTNSFKIKEKYFYPYINIEKCKEVVRNESRIKTKTRKKL